MSEIKKWTIASSEPHLLNTSKTIMTTDRIGHNAKLVNNLEKK